MNPRYEIGRPHRIIGKYLDKLIDGEIKRLMVFAPPRSGKSELGSRMLPAYALGRNPHLNVIACSYSDALANRMNRDCQRIIDTPEYQGLFPATRLGARANRERVSIRTEDFFEVVGHRGSYRSAGVGGSIGGMGFDLGIIDDPIKDFDQSMSQVIRDKVYEWYTSTFWTRQSPDARIVIIMTRWSVDDLCGRLLQLMEDDRTAEKWEVVKLPAICESVEDLHPDDDRIPGEPLWPEHFPLEFLESARSTQSPFQWAALYQQSPTVAGGNHFKSDWFNSDRRYKDVDDYWFLGALRWHKKECAIFSTVDPATSEDRTHDETAIGVFAITPDGFLLVLEIYVARIDIDQLVPEILRVSRIWNPTWICVEDNGFQVAIVREARRTRGMPAIREINSQGKGKFTRATPAVILAQAGRMLLPTQATWVKPTIDELCRFTGFDDAHDGRVDVIAYAVLQMPGHYDDERVELKQKRGILARPTYESNAARRGLFGRTM